MTMKLWVSMLILCVISIFLLPNDAFAKGKIKSNNKEVSAGETIISSQTASALVEEFMYKNKFITIHDKSDKILTDFLNNKIKWKKND